MNSSISDWLLRNREWLFSGAGLSVAGLIYRFIVYRGVSDQRSTAMHLNQNPVINNIINNQAPQQVVGSQGMNDDVDAGEQQNRAVRPQLFALSPLVGERSSHDIYASPDREPVKVQACVARFRLAADSAVGINHRLEASIEYLEAIRIRPRPRLILRRMAIINQALWIVPRASAQIVKAGNVLQLLLAFKQDDLLLTLGAAEGGSTSQLSDIHVGIDPIVRVLLVDADFGWRWTIDYRLEQFPLQLSEASSLREIG